MPHHPYVWLPSGRRYVPPQPEIPGLYGDNMWRRDSALVDRAWQRYLFQVGYTDLLIGRLMRRLKATGLWDRSLVVVLPDHGVSFLPGRSRRTATPSTVGGIGVIPFLMKLPGQHLGRRVDAHVQTIDVLPTVAAALGLARPRDTDGHDALDPTFQPSPAAELWSTTSVVTFGRHLYAMSLVQRRLAELVARQRARFGTGPFAGRFYRIGPRADLVGRPTRELPPGSRRIAVTLDQPARGAPSIVSGTAMGVSPGRTLALVVRGRVAATTRTYAFRGVRFSAAVPRGAPAAVYAVS
jgi:sulfatase-like protein